MKKKKYIQLTFAIGITAAVNTSAQEVTSFIAVDRSNQKTGYVIDPHRTLEEVEKSQIDQILRDQNLVILSGTAAAVNAPVSTDHKPSEELIKSIKGITGDATEIKTVNLKDMKNSTQEGW